MDLSNHENHKTTGQPAGPSGSAGSAVFLTKTRKALIGLLVVGALAAVGAGTFASFTAQTNNANNTFQTGTITLNDQVNSGTACWSTGTGNGQGSFSNGNVNNTCSSFVSATNQAPGAAASNAVVTVTTAGSLTPSSLTLSTSCSSSNVVTSANGNGNLCDYIAVTVQPCATYSSGATCATKDSNCLFPVAAAQCVAPAVSGGPPPTAGNLTQLAGSYTLATSPAPGYTKSYQISWAFPDSGVAGRENPVQGRIANWAFKFTAVQ